MSALSQFIGGGNRIKSIQHISTTLNYTGAPVIQSFVSISEGTPSKTIVSLTDNTIVNAGSNEIYTLTAVAYLYSSTSLYFRIGNLGGEIYYNVTLAATVVEFL